MYILKDSIHAKRHKFLRKCSLMNWLLYDCIGIAKNLNVDKVSFIVYDTRLKKHTYRTIEV